VANQRRIWDEDVERDPGRDILRYRVRPRNVTEMLLGVDKWATRTYLVQGTNRVIVEEFLSAMRRGARWLTTRGVGPDDRVMLWSYNRIEFVLAVWSCWWAGAVPVLANRWWNPTELSHAADQAKPVLTLVDEDIASTALHAPCAEIQELTGFLLDADGVRADPPAAERHEDDPAVILFTSGSSGPPKGVQLSQRSVVANQQNLLVRANQLPDRLDPDSEQQVVLASTPMFHIGALTILVTQLLTGGRLVLTAGAFDPAEVLELIERERVHRWGGVPTMAERVLSHPDFETRDLSSLRSFPLGGAPLPDTLLQRLQTALPQLRERGLANTWGMTEAGGYVTAAGGRELRDRPGTVGRPFPVCELSIIDPDDDGVGEVLVRSPTIMTDYVSSDREDIFRDGWLRTGDLGRIDEDGYLFLVGRSKDIVIRGGENIACAHVEQTLLGHPDVVEVAVVGLAHEDLGEEVAAVVRRRAGSGLEQASLHDFAAARLARFEVPSVWEIIDDPLPTLGVEKVDKDRLRERLESARS